MSYFVKRLVYDIFRPKKKITKIILLILLILLIVGNIGISADEVGEDDFNDDFSTFAFVRGNDTDYEYVRNFIQFNDAKSYVFTIDKTGFGGLYYSTDKNAFYTVDTKLYFKKGARFCSVAFGADGRLFRGYDCVVSIDDTFVLDYGLLTDGKLDYGFIYSNQVIKHKGFVYPDIFERGYLTDAEKIAYVFVLGGVCFIVSRFKFYTH